MSGEDTATQVERIIDKLLSIIRDKAGAIDESAVMWWRDYYRPKFVRAIDENHRDYERDRPMLQRKTRALANRARSLAGTGPIMPDHAKAASETEACGSDADDDPSVQEYWCY